MVYGGLSLALLFTTCIYVGVFTAPAFKKNERVSNVLFFPQDDTVAFYARSKCGCVVVTLLVTPGTVTLAAVLC